MRLVADWKSFPITAHRVVVPEGETCPGCQLPTDVVVVVPDESGGEVRSCCLCAAVGHLEDTDSRWVALPGGPALTARLVAATRLSSVVCEIASLDLTQAVLHVRTGGPNGAEARVNAQQGKVLKDAGVAVRNALATMLVEAVDVAKEWAMVNLATLSVETAEPAALAELAMLPVGDVVLDAHERHVLLRFITERILGTSWHVESLNNVSLVSEIAMPVSTLDESLFDKLVRKAKTKPSGGDRAASMMALLAMRSGFLEGQEAYERAAERLQVELDDPFIPDWNENPPRWFSTFYAGPEDKGGDFRFALKEVLSRSGWGKPPTDGNENIVLDQKSIKAWDAAVKGGDWTDAEAWTDPALDWTSMLDDIGLPHDEPPRRRKGDPLLDSLVAEAAHEPLGAYKAARLLALLALRLGVLDDEDTYRAAVKRVFVEMEDGSVRNRDFPEWDAAWSNPKRTKTGFLSVLGKVVEVSGWRSPLSEEDKMDGVLDKALAWDAVVEGMEWQDAASWTDRNLDWSDLLEDIGIPRTKSVGDTLSEGLPPPIDKIVQIVDIDGGFITRNAVPHEGKTVDE